MQLPEANETREPVISAVNKMLVTGAFTELDNAPAIPQTAKSGIYSAGNPKFVAINPSRLPERAPMESIGKKIPPGIPLPKLVQVNISLTSIKISSITISASAFSAICIKF